MDDLKLDVKNGGGSIHSIDLFNNDKPSELVLKVLAIQKIVSEVFRVYYASDFFGESEELERYMVTDLHSVIEGILSELIQRYINKIKPVSIVTVSGYYLEGIEDPFAFFKISERLRVIFEHYLLWLDGDTIPDMPIAHLLDAKNFFHDIFYRCFEIQFKANI